MLTTGEPRYTLRSVRDIHGVADVFYVATKFKIDGKQYGYYGKKLDLAPGDEAAFIAEIEEETVKLIERLEKK